jgi:hypothetical protein
MEPPILLPFALELAAVTTELDNVNIKHTNDMNYVKIPILTLYWFGWRDRLLRKSSKRISDDIKKYSQYKKDCDFLIHNQQLISYFYTKHLIFRGVNLFYSINSDTIRRQIKLKKLKKIIDDKSKRVFR